MIELLALLAAPNRAAASAYAVLEAAKATGIAASSLPGGRNAGDLVVRAKVRADRANGLMRGLQALFPGSDAVLFERAAGSGDVLGQPIYRGALFCANRAPDAGRIAQFGAELLAMPRHVPQIGAWTLGTVVAAIGARNWTFVWEQGFARLENLTEGYMNHPYHWGHVDRWFDPENPLWLIDPTLCHAFCEVPSP